MTPDRRFDCQTGAMRDAGFELKVRSGGWTHHPNGWSEPDARMVSFTLVVLRDGKPLGGHNVQAHVTAATGDGARPVDVDVWLSSGWRVSFRNQFAQAPGVASRIIASVEAELSEITGALETARGADMVAVKDRLWATTFHARGSDFWR